MMYLIDTNLKNVLESLICSFYGGRKVKKSTYLLDGDIV